MQKKFTICHFYCFNEGKKTKQLNVFNAFRLITKDFYHICLATYIISSVSLYITSSWQTCKHRFQFTVLYSYGPIIYLPYLKWCLEAKHSVPTYSYQRQVPWQKLITRHLLHSSWYPQTLMYSHDKAMKL